MRQSLESTDRPWGIDYSINPKLTVDAAQFAFSEMAGHPTERRRSAELNPSCLVRSTSILRRVEADPVARFEPLPDLGCRIRRFCLGSV
jgi:hypothetical protein